MSRFSFVEKKVKQQSCLYTVELVFVFVCFTAFTDISGYKKIGLADTQTPFHLIPILKTCLLLPITFWMKSQLLSIPPKAFLLSLYSDEAHSSASKGSSQ